MEVKSCAIFHYGIEEENISFVKVDVKCIGKRRCVFGRGVIVW